jgi:glyoxylase-like metal-dependent hydrolase (beta-lactamase superfamily II)
MLNVGDGLAVGKFRLDPIVEFQGPRMPACEMFPALASARAADLLERVPSDGFDAASSRLVTSVHSWLVRSSDGICMLIDTCFGNLKPRPNFPIFHMQRTRWLANLSAAGVAPEQVTHVVNTHLHHDHVGWNTFYDGDQWKPTFPRARYLLPKVEVDAGASGLPAWNGGAFEDSVAPVLAAGLAELVTPLHQIEPGIRLIAAPGHSAGMMIVEVSDGGTSILAGGDPMHHAIQLLAPELNTRFCENPGAAAATRRALLERCADEDLLLAATHFCAPRAMRVRRDGDGFALV